MAVKTKILIPVRETTSGQRGEDVELVKEVEVTLEEAGFTVGYQKPSGPDRKGIRVGKYVIPIDDLQKAYDLLQAGK